MNDLHLRGSAGCELVDCPDLGFAKAQRFIFLQHSILEELDTRPTGKRIIASGLFLKAVSPSCLSQV